MTTINSLNPHPENRPTLKSLQECGILNREMIGLRNIIRAAIGIVEPFGYSIEGIYNLTRNEPSLSNFVSGSRRDVKGLVGHAGGRAEIHVTTSYQDTHMTTNDVSMCYPVNQLATDILKQPCTKQAYFDPDIPAYGDAVLITDRRYHWVLPKGNSSDADFAAIDVLLTTPRTISRRWSGPGIVFLEEPNGNDIFSIMLARQ